MSLSVTGTQANVTVDYFQANFSTTQTSQFQATGGDGQQTVSYSSATTLSLSISAIHVTSRFLSAEQVIEDTQPDGHHRNRAQGLENALKDLFKELDENDGLTGKVAKRLYKLVSSLNAARGTDNKLGHLDKQDREEVRSARQQVNDFFRQKHAKVFIDQELSNFISLVSKLETLREFVLRTEDLLTALKGRDEDSDDTNSEEQPPLINIEA